MKFNKSSQLLLVSAASLLVAGLITACGTLTVDFVYVASSKAAGPNNYGQIDVFEINSESGVMRQIPSSPFPSGGRDPVSEAVSSDYSNLFVANQIDNTIVQFVIGNDGKLYPENTVNTPGVYPLAVAVNGMNLFVVDTYQPLPTCSTAQPCSSSIAVYPLTTGGSAASDPCPATVCIESPAVNTSISAAYWPLSLPTSTSDVIEATGIYVLPAGNYVYVAAYDATTTSIYAYSNFIFGFSIGSGGVLTPLNGGAPLGGTLAGGAFATLETCNDAFLNAPFIVGTCPSAITSDSTGNYVYVTDVLKGIVLGYSVSSGTGLLTSLSGNPFPAGDQPSALVADPSYPYLYVTNALDSTITAYSMNSGELTSIGTYGSGGVEPVAIGIDPSTYHFLYAVNFLGNTLAAGTVGGFELSPTAGTLVNSQSSPYISNLQPTAVAAIPHNGSGAGVQK
jgi:6-phosphogluconolactonase (cycloisomerase 2 family)